MLELRGVTKFYDRQIGARDVTICVPTGSRTVIVGPSGSGKTTLLRLIAGFETPDAGTIALDGRVLSGPTECVPPHRRNMAYVPQEGALFPHMSVAANIGFALARRAPDRQDRIDALMVQVGLARDLRERRPHQLSGGQQQRVALARALAQQPELMLLDEPFSALDSGLRDAMRTMVGDLLAQSGITAVMVTHDQAEAMAFADHLVVMRQGVVADAGPPQRLYEQPADVQTARFLGEAIILPANLKDGLAITPLGPLPVRSCGTGSASVLIRPEQIILCEPTDRRAPAAAWARVQHRSFCGSHWRLDVDLLPQDSAQAGVGPTASLLVPAHVHHAPGALLPINIRGQAHVMPQEG